MYTVYMCLVIREWTEVFVHIKLDDFVLKKIARGTET